MTDAQLYTAYKCQRIVLEEGIIDGFLFVDSESGKISKISTNQEECEPLLKTSNLVEVEKGVLMAGVVDSHVHINSPGRSEWEDFSCATKAAAANGTTTIADMPLNSIPPTTTLENLKTKADVARGTVYVDVAFWGGVVPNNQNDLLEMINAGVVGFKCFLCPSGVDEFPHVNEDELKKALEILEKTDSLLAFHAECELDDKCQNSLDDPEEYNTYLCSRPPEMELKALNLIMKMTELYEARYHIVHVSAASGAELVTKAKNRGVKITAETCPHYLTLVAEEVPRSATHFKCAPPVRSNTNREALWNCLKRGEIDMVVSDHSPCTPVLKTESFMSAWGGISSMQFSLSLVWTEALKRGFDLCHVSRLMSKAPSTLCGLQDSKGALKEGLDADFIVFDPEDTFVISQDCIHHKNKLTPYLAMELTGKVLQTYLRGRLIYDNGSFSTRPIGKLLLNFE